ncbi:MAG: hypothetical protein ACI8YB_001074, partial [Patiriisocius sp.]
KSAIVTLFRPQTKVAERKSGEMRRRHRAFSKERYC